MEELTYYNEFTKTNPRLLRIKNTAVTNIQYLIQATLQLAKAI